MWAGGALEFLAPLHVGERLTRETWIANVVEKSGAAGDMVFVTLVHDISGPRKRPQHAPVLGQHTEEVLADVVGMSDAEMGKLFDKGIVQAPTLPATGPPHKRSLGTAPKNFLANGCDAS